METGEKESNTKHLIQCLNTFIENHKIIKSNITKGQIDPKTQENEELESLLNVTSRPKQSSIRKHLYFKKTLYIFSSQMNENVQEYESDS
jgi:hypothetical protein